MTKRLRRILIMVVMALFTVTLMAASLLCTVTYGRYAGGKFDSEKSVYDQNIEFVGANQYVVYSPEELVQAIENGYSYIQIANEAEEPFVITTGVTNVTANLVLDLNGKTIVRNSRNPVLDVQTNVSTVLVYDSSEEQDGGFYNPVGSALQVSGGTLTVAAGIYNSGPESDVSNELPTEEVEVNVFYRDGDRAEAEGYTTDDESVTSMPKITGDIYLDENWEGTGNNTGNNYIEADTYLIYTVYIEADTYLIYTVEESAFVLEANTVVDGETLTAGKLYLSSEVDGVTTITEFSAPACDAASCDFYYYYPIPEDENNPSEEITIGENQTITVQNYAVVYGYNDVKAMAGNTDSIATNLTDDGLIWPYAAVRSVLSATTQESAGGNGYMRGGKFYTNFGTVNTYGIYAEGGTLTVANNTTNSDTNTTFTAVGQGVCIRSQNPADTTQNASLEISGGNFSSELGDTIQMEGGNVTVTGGQFTKNASAADENSENNGSAINITGGTLKISEEESAEVTFTVTGNYVNGIKMSQQGDNVVSGTINGADFNFNEDNGGTSVAAIQLIGGQLEVENSNFKFNQKANATFSANNGIYVQSGNVTATDCTFNVLGYSSFGVYASGGTTTVTGGKITMTGNGTTNIGNNVYGNDNFGIEVSGGEVTAEGCVIEVTGTYSAGILSRGGTVNLGSYNDGTKDTYIDINVGDNNTVLSSSAVSSESVTNENGSTTAGVINVTGNITIESNSLGITARGQINVNSGIATVTTTRATGVYVNNGEINIESGATLDVTSTINAACSWVQPPEGSTAMPSSTTNGIYINSGSITSYGQIIVENTVSGGDWAADNNISKTVSQFNGIYVQGGSLEVSGDGGSLQLNNEIKSTYQSGSNSTWPALADDQGNSISGYNGIFVDGGSFTSTGTGSITFDNNTTATGLYISHTGVQSDAPGSGENAKNNDGNAYRNFQVKSYAVRVEGDNPEVTIAAGEIKNTIGGGVLVNGGTVTLGAEGDGPTVSADGDEYYGTYISINGNSADNWQYAAPSTGGDAVKVVGGELTIHGGEYTAKHGNGILVSDGSAEVYGGTFTGIDQRNVEESKKENPSYKTGAGSSYGLKVLGGSATIYDGHFVNSDGGMFIMGRQGARDTTIIEKAEIKALYATAISVWDYANVTFGTLGGANSNLTATASSTGLAVEKTTDTTDTPSTDTKQTIVINSGTFTGNVSGGTQSGIWYGNGYATMEINGGEFTGGTSGLYFSEAPGTHTDENSKIIPNVQISNGTFYGRDNELYWNSVINYGNNTTNNAISGSSVSFSSIIVSGHTVTGYTEYDGTFTGSGAEIDSYSDSVVDLTYGNVNYKGNVIFHTGLGWRDYNVDLVYSRIEVR